MGPRAPRRRRPRRRPLVPRRPPGRAAYDAGHIPGAVYVDLDEWLAAPGSAAEGRHPLPDPGDFAEGMARLGIGDDDTVVGYDDAGGVIAARLVWMLRATGRDAALLDGGLGAWRRAAGDRRRPSRPPPRFTARPWPADRIAVDRRRGRPGQRRARRPPARALPRRRRTRSTRAPATSRARGTCPRRENLDETGRLLPVDELRARLGRVGVGAGHAAVVSSCGSGVTACHNLLVMEHAGLGARPALSGVVVAVEQRPGTAHRDGRRCCGRNG